MQELHRGRIEAVLTGFSFHFCSVRLPPSYWLFFLIKTKSKVIELPVNVFEHIKRLMGWCQKNELEFAHSNTINPRMSMNAVHAKYGASGRRCIKILVDSSRDAGITRILVPASVTTFLLLLININYSVIDIIAISIFYLALVLLLLQNNTTVELAPDSIIIHRPVLKPVEIQKKSIEKIEITKNPAYKPRWILYPVSFVALLILIGKNVISARLNFASSAPLIVKFITAYSIPLTTVFFAVISYHYLVRPHNPTILKFVVENREVTFYTNNPRELMNKLGVIQ